MSCDAKPRSDYPNEEEVKGDKKGTYVAQSDSLCLYPIYQVLVSGCNKSVTVFCDGGSNASYITHRAPQMSLSMSQRWEMWSVHITPNNTSLR